MRRLTTHALLLLAALLLGASPAWAASKYWVGWTGNWNASNTANWSAADPISFTASCTTTALVTTGSPSLVNGMTVWSSTGVSLGTIVSGSGNAWVVSVGGTYTSQAMTAATTGAAVPTASDNVFFDANSGAGTATIVTATALANNLDFTGYTGTLAGSTASTISGNLVLASTGSWTYTGTITFNSTNAQTITSNTRAINNPVVFDGVSGSWVLQDDFATGATRTTTLTNGTLNLNNHNLLTGIFNSNNSNARTLTSGSGQINVTYAGGGSVSAAIFGTTGLTVTDRPTFLLTGNNTAGNRTISLGTLPEATAPSVVVSNGSDPVLVGQSVFNLTFSPPFTGTWTNSLHTIYGNLTLIAGQAAPAAGTSATTFGATSGTKTIITAAQSLDFPLIFNGSGGTFRLQDDLLQGSTRALTLTNGTIDLNNHTLTPGAWALGSGTKVLATATSGKLSIIASGATAFDGNTNGAGFTTTGTGKISLTSASAKTFVGAGKTYPVLEQAGAGTLTVTGANTFADIQSTAGDVTVTLPASTTTTVSAFTLGGTSGHPVTLNSSSSGTAATLSKASGTVSVSNLSIKDSAATGGAAWQAYLTNGNTNTSGNSGWVFISGTPGNLLLLGVGS